MNWASSVSAGGGLSAPTESNHALPVAPNLLNRDFAPGEHNRVWVSDITYIPTRQGWVYLAGIKDLHSREIVGFSLAERMDTGLVLAALMKAVRLHRPPVSDRGSQYCSVAYQKRLRSYGLVCSMSKKGDCYDNAPMESFWGLLKNELVHRKSYSLQAEAITDISEHIEVFYNRQRRQAALGLRALIAVSVRAIWGNPPQVDQTLPRSYPFLPLLQMTTMNNTGDPTSPKAKKFTVF